MKPLESTLNTPAKMPLKVLIIAACLLSLIVIIANYSVQFHLGDTPLTFGALTYPFSFLLLDVLSEKYRRQDVTKIIALAICIAFYPSYLSATSQIALASIAAFCISQPIDVVIFYAFKRFFPKLWWLRNCFSTIFAQSFDTLIFFSFAFWGVKSFNECMDMAVADYMIKAFVGVMNTPLFYILAIRARCLWQKSTLESKRSRK